MDWFSAPHQREEWYSAGDVPGALAGVRWSHNYFPDVTQILRSLNDGLRVHTPREKVSAQDDSGNAAEQTLIRAYAVR
ncbi:hypothetical protein ACGF5C_30065 [Micromonospora sp. NPDC047620]|uniref:hypothetical protein n=1 Tax=Micromonospora sp. NPDC047620 TaxID=3364251 RepID=UPI0037179A91